MKSPVLFIMLFLTTACGYHLRGSVDLPDALNKIFISNASAQLNSAFKKIYTDKLVSSPLKAKLVIKILTESFNRHTISTDTSGYSNEFSLNYHLEFNILDSAGNILKADQRVRLSRSYFNDQSGATLLAKNNEEALLRKELYSQAVYSITNKARAALAK
jgi:LPS-assembly lipoprotein